ncbi:hypothetical protein HDU67_009386, partial [Dinochytrium kinnereticum]
MPRERDTEDLRVITLDVNLYNRVHARDFIATTPEQGIEMSKIRYIMELRTLIDEERASVETAQAADRRRELQTKMQEAVNALKSEESKVDHQNNAGEKATSNGTDNIVDDHNWDDWVNDLETFLEDFSRQDKRSKENSECKEQEIFPDSSALKPTSIDHVILGKDVSSSSPLEMLEVLPNISFEDVRQVQDVTASTSSENQELFSNTSLQDMGQGHYILPS